MPNYEYQGSERVVSASINSVLQKHSGMLETLRGWSSESGEHAEPIPFDEIVKILAHDAALRTAARDFLSPGGEGFSTNPDYIDHMRERLAWALVDELGR